MRFFLNDNTLQKNIQTHSSTFIIIESNFVCKHNIIVHIFIRIKKGIQNNVVENV